MASEKTYGIMELIIAQVLEENPGWLVDEDELFRLKSQCELVDSVLNDINKYGQRVHALELTVDDVMYGISFVIETENFEIQNDSSLINLIESGVRVLSVSSISGDVLRLILIVDGVWVMEK